jgi:hypothetical protein
MNFHSGMDFLIEFHSRHGFSEGCTSIPGVANPLVGTSYMYVTTVLLYVT